MRGRWLAIGGGGYQLVSVVPRTWTHLLAAVADNDIAPATPIPTAWRELAQKAAVARMGAGGEVPETMGEGGDVTFPPWDRRRTIPLRARTSRWRPNGSSLARARLLFPLHGLDPEDPRD